MLGEENKELSEKLESYMDFDKVMVKNEILNKDLECLKLSIERTRREVE